MMQLDDLARTAGTDLAESVAAMRVPPPASPRARRAASVVSLLVLIAVVVGLVVVRTGLEREDGFVDPRAPRHFVLDTDGTPWRPISVMDATTMANPVFLTVFFGEARADDPFAAKDAQVGISPYDRRMHAEPANVTVNGEPGHTSTGRWLGDAEVRTLLFRAGDSSVRVVSMHLDEPSLIELAEALRIEGDDVALERSVLGMARIGPTLRSDDLRMVTYREEGDTSLPLNARRTIDLTTWTGDAEMLRQARWRGARPTEVDGRPAMVTEYEAAGGATAFNLSWVRADGVVLSINAAASEDEARALIPRVRSVSEDEWRALGEAAVAALFEQSRPPGGAAPVTTTAR